MFNDLKDNLEKMIEDNSKKKQQVMESNNAVLLQCIKDIKDEMLKKIDKKIDEKLHLFAASNEKLIEEKINERLPSDAADERAIEQKIKVQVAQSFDELREREERKFNLIVYNITESTKANVEEEKQEDISKVKDVLNFTNPDLKDSIIQNLSAKCIFRLGQKEIIQEQQQEQQQDKQQKIPKPRPIKIILPDEKTKYSILRNAHTLKSYQAQNRVGIKLDLTKQQHLEDKLLKEELEKRKKEEGLDLMIFRGEIIKREDHARLKNAKKGAKKSDENVKPKQQ